MISPNISQSCSISMNKMANSVKCRNFYKTHIFVNSIQARLAHKVYTYGFETSIFFSGWFGYRDYGGQVISLIVLIANDCQSTCKYQICIYIIVLLSAQGLGNVSINDWSYFIRVLFGVTEAIPTKLPQIRMVPQIMWSFSFLRHDFYEHL